MQVGAIGTEYKNDLANSKFRTSFAFLNRADLAGLPEGWIELDNGVRASVQHYTTMEADALSFETHERFFDIQYLIEGKRVCRLCEPQGVGGENSV